MAELVIGKSKIIYKVRESQKAKKKKIVITPAQVEVIVPRGTPAGNITDFMEKQKNRVFTSRQKIIDKLMLIENFKPDHYVSGAKILYRGRMIKLIVQNNNVNDCQVKYRNRFFITVPYNMSVNQLDYKIKQALEDWMKKRIELDVKSFVKTYGQKIKLLPAGIRIKEHKHLWASCSKDRIININWRLIRFPKQILEYVVVHEICHLKYRNHSPQFWVLLGSVFPEYDICKKWLELKGDYLV